MRPIDAATFLSADELDAESSLSGEELARAFWRVKRGRDEVARKDRYWASICDALEGAYAELEATTAALAASRAELARLNAELEARVDAQVGEIRVHAARIDLLNAQLHAKVQDRSRELLAMARELRGARESLEPGTMLGNTCVREPIGEGGAGVVYRAEDEVGASVAVKVLRRPESPEATVRFLVEAISSNRVPHPAVVRPLRVDLTPSGLPYIVMELVEGRSLRAQLASHGGLPLAAAVRLAAVLADALATAHEAGIAHRDIKPGNLMLTPAEPGLRVLDFGLSKALDGADSSHVTLAGRLIGTPAYMAPEQIRDPSTAHAAADVYSAGATLFELVTGTPPFRASSVERLCYAHLHDAPPALPRSTPSALSELVAACLAKPAGSRPSSRDVHDRLVELAEALGAAPAHDEASRLLAGGGLGATVSL